jgi:hypothetical protein
MERGRGAEGAVASWAACEKKAQLEAELNHRDKRLRKVLATNMAEFRELVREASALSSRFTIMACASRRSTTLALRLSSNQHRRMEEDAHAARRAGRGRPAGGAAALAELGRDGAVHLGECHAGVLRQVEARAASGR